MKVEIVAPEDGHTGLYLQRAFEALGHAVSHFDYRASALPNDVLFRRNADLKPDLTVILKGECFAPDLLRSIRPLVLWNFDLWYRTEPWFLDLAKAAKVFLTPAGGEVLEEFRRQGINAHYLPEAADPELHRPVYGLTRESQETYGADVAFIGTVKDVPGRDEWLATVGRWCDDNKKVLKIWGSYPGELSKRWHTGYRAAPVYTPTSRTEDDFHNMVVSASKVILDRQRNPEIEGAVSARVFRTLAAKGFMVARYTKGVEKLFNPGWDMLTYGDDEECVRVIEQALGETKNPFTGDVTDHSVERKVVGRHGWETVMAKHKFTDRVEELLKLL